jgi:hypothetical protein
VQMAVMRAKALSRTPAKDLAKHVVAALPLRIGGESGSSPCTGDVLHRWKKSRLGSVG